MREAVRGEQAMGCPDRGLLGGFSASVQRHLHADRKAGGAARSWAMAAFASYGLKNAADREEACLRLSLLVPPAPTPAPGGGSASLKDPVESLPGVGPKVAAKMHSMGLRTLGDLVEHLPRDYLDRRAVRTIRELRVGQVATVLATVRDSKVDRTRNGRRLVRVTVGDGSGYLECVWWNQDWRARQLSPGTQAAFSGKVEARAGRPQMSGPAYDLIGSSDDPVHTGRIVPVYPASEQVSAVFLRRLLHTTFERLGRLSDPLPAAVRAERNLLSRDLASRRIHFPKAPEDVSDARRRLVFEELFVLQLALALRKRHLEQDVRGIAHDPASGLPGRFLETLPFAPTAAQSRAMAEITSDMARPRPMHRLLQGEVGSGKTLVAVHAALVAAGSGSQAAIMAPTEVLAEQHARKVREMLEPVGVDVALITSSVPASVRRDAVMRLRSGDIAVACGTHALLSEDVGFDRLGLAVVDEQHRFGLSQRVLLREKGDDPDVLIMTATPIPRTLALTLYGDLDVSVLDELPSGRQPITTELVDGDDERARDRAYDAVREEVGQGRRAYVICPLVDESDSLAAKAAVAEAERLRTKVFPDLSVGLMHGQMRPADKDRVMREFRSGEISVLISTTVVEVGVDVPEATVMLIEDAERFGLSQLHQLRGRIGRGSWPSRCILFSGKKTEEGRRRLEAIASSNDGFYLAEQDLEIRGEGTIFGTRQAGLVDLKVARLVEDYPVVVESRKAAFELVEADPKLRRPEHAALRDEVSRRFSGVVDWLFRG
ncbi:MAG TPA: ATP-dependent DNA helicase RecG [Actinomycetota bacterium]|nr:ATP-dependent DNA helicase RecG [Actinomycetota bacterium]